jgi:phage gpG-like protein
MEYPLVIDKQFTGFSVTVENMQPILEKYNLTIDRAEHMEPAMRLIGRHIKDLIRANFESEGRRRGGSWAALKPATIRKKMRLVAGTSGLTITGSNPHGGFTTKRGNKFGPTLHPVNRKGVPKHVFEPVRLTDRLYNAAVGHTDESVGEIGARHVIVGVEGIPYAQVQRFGGGKNKIPGRDYLLITQADRIRMMQIIEDYVYEQWFGGVSGAKRTRGYGGYVYPISGSQ